MGIELEFYDATAVRARFPFSRPAALFSKDGGQVDPHRLTHGLLAAGKRAGLEVYDRTKMTHLEETRRGVRITTHNGCRITARRAVIAAGFESNALLNTGAGTLKSTYALISEPLPDISEWHQQCLIWESGTPYLYLRTTTEGRVIIGGEDEDFVNAKRRDALISQKTRTPGEKVWATVSGSAIGSSLCLGRHFWKNEGRPSLHRCPYQVSALLFCAESWWEWHHLQRHRRRDPTGLFQRPDKSRC